MTDEKRYEAVCSMLRAFDAAANMDGVADMVIKKPQDWQYGNAFNTFYTDAAKLLIEARQNMDRKATGAGRLAAINRIYKSAAGNVRESLRGIYKSDGRWAICDGYRFIRLNVKPDSIPECAGLDLSKTIPQDAKDGEEVTLPGVAEIKAQIAELKAKYGKGWKYQPVKAFDGWWCNPQYLLDMVQALPNGKAYRPKNYYSPLYYESEDGDALLLPARHTEQEEKSA